MIGRISGILLEKNPPQLLVDCNGVGYEVDVPMSTYYNLPQLGEIDLVLLTNVRAATGPVDALTAAIIASGHPMRSVGR